MSSTRAAVVRGGRLSAGLALSYLGVPRVIARGDGFFALSRDVREPSPKYNPRQNNTNKGAVPSDGMSALGH